MIKVEIFRKNGSIVGYKASGHSGYSEQGSDIICSAISTSMQMTLAGIQEVLKLEPKFKMSDGFLDVDLKDISQNKFTEIDMIMLHPSGLYIFESKNIKGWIFGKEDDTYWTQCLLNNRGKTDKFKFLNPIKQNKQHIKIFKKYAKYRPIPVYNCVVFGENSTFKNVQIDSSDIIICSIENILNNIEENKHFSENNLTTEQICKIYNKLYPLTLRTEEFKKRHIDRIKKETY